MLHQDAEALFLAGTVAMAAGDMKAAEDSFTQAIALYPTFAEAYANLEFLMECKGAFLLAEAHYLRALAYNPAISQTWVNLGSLLVPQKRLAGAEAAYCEAIALDAASISAWSNLGVVYANMHRSEDAEHCYRTAPKYLPHIPLPVLISAICCCVRAALRKAGAVLKYGTGRMRSPFPRWRGENPAGRQVLMTSEGGYGDMIQFCRYAAVLKAAGAARVTVLCPPALKELFETLRAAARVIDSEESVQELGCDVWTPAFSVPHFQGISSLDDIPADIPYLYAPQHE